MRRASVLSGSAFRSAIMFSIIFVVVLGVAGTLIVLATRQSIVDQLKAGITEDIELLRDANATGGERELLRFVQHAVATRSDKQFAFGLFNANGVAEAGNVTVAPKLKGFGVLAHEPGPDPKDDFLGMADMVGDSLVVVGRSQHVVSSVGDAIVVPLLVAGLVICVSALVIGYVLSRNVSAKLQVIDDTLGEVSRGNSTVRLPIGAFDDQIDRVSQQINTHLAKLSEFMTLMRNTIVAIAHDLKSPLNRAYIQVQEAVADETVAPEKLEQVLVELETLSGVLDTVLRISRIESSEDTSTFAAFSPVPLMRDLVETFQPVIEAGGRSMVADIGNEDGPPIFGDARMVRQMVANLIENANRHSGEGTRVTLELGRAGDAARIVVADNGRGIPIDKYDEVFQPFRRLDADRHSPGTGLGLALVRAITTRHRARIELSDSRPGLRVIVTFPAISAPS